MTDRDHFAAAALTGLLAQGDDGSFSEESYVRAAYRWADAMLRERANHPAAPDSSPVTEPMPKEKRAEVSVGIDGTDHPVPYSRTDEKRVNWPTIRDTTQPRSGAVDEPVAWAIERADGGSLMGFCHTKREASRFAHAVIEDTKSDHFTLRHVPLYRHPQPTLTDAEREVIGAILVDPDSAPANSAATLRGLLERLK